MINGAKTLNNFKEIPQLEYEGYIWESSKENPKKVTSEAELTKYENSGKPANPFIMEGHLYNKDKNISISIRHVSGRYYITQFNLGELDEKTNFVDKFYLANKKLEKENKLHFKEIWLPEPDENCPDMQVMTKKAVVFAGFRKKEDNHDN